MSSLSWHLAWRYIRRHPDRKHLAFSTVVSASGVALGVAALVVVMSVMSGLEEFISESVLIVDSPLVVVPSSGASLDLSDELLQEIEAFPEVGSVSPYVQGEAIARLPGKGIDAGCIVRGVDPDREFAAAGTSSRMSWGEAVLMTPDGYPCTVMGLYLAEEFAHPSGDTLLFFSPGALFSSRSFGMGRAILSGAIETGLPVNDQSIAYLPLELAQRMYLPDGGYSGISIRPAEGYSVDEAATVVSPLLPETALLETWQERNPGLMASMKLERLGSFMAILLIILVATFNIVGTISRSAVERTADIAILKAMGAARRLIMKVFLWEGVLVGTVGIVAGVALGLAGCWVIGSTDLVHLPDVYSFHENMPLRMSFVNILIISTAAMALSVLSGVIPAVRAASLDPVRGLCK
jgi:lipoprotein-releasing system permease protein